MDNYGVRPQSNKFFFLNKFRSRQFMGGKFLRYLLILFVLFMLVIGIKRVMNVRAKSKDLINTSIGQASDVQILNKEFQFPLKDGNGDEVSRIKYEIQKAEKRDEIIVKGQKARSVADRTFLILTIKITNDYKSSIQLNSKDYIRLAVGGNENEWLAPDIHNDPVEIQAISTKYTRLGFPINKDEKKLTLRVGEVNGDKENLELSLK